MPDLFDPFCFLDPFALSKRQSWQPMRNYEDWQKVALQGWMMWADAGAVIVLRTCRLMGGGQNAEYEARTMVTEKMSAMAEAATGLVLAGPVSGSTAARTAMAPFRKRVSANRRRLTKTARSAARK